MYRTHHVGTDGIGRSCSGNTEVGKLYLTVCGDHNILGLYITMHETALVGGFQSQRNLNSNTGGLTDTQFFLSFNIILQRDALYQLHYNKVGVFILAYIIYTDNIRMGKACCSLCLLLEFAHKALIHAELLAKHLHGYQAV